MTVQNGSTNGHAGGQLVGRVEAVNERGVKIGGSWLNISKWAEGVTLPERGARVAVSLDTSGFIRAIGPAETCAEPTQVSRRHSPVAGREAAITRLAVLRTAATFCAARPDLRSGDLFALAERMEAWVLREDA